MRSLVVSVALLAGCDTVFGLEREDDLVDARMCIGKAGVDGAGLLEVCIDGPLAERLDVPPDIDTEDLPPVCTQIVMQEDALRTEVCALIARRIDITSAVVIHGRRPIAFVALDTLTVTSDLDGSSKRGRVDGPAGNAGGCDVASMDGSPSDTGGGGAAGGTFASKGGHGGATSGGAGGAEEPELPIGILRAGCNGGRGGKGVSTGLGGPGGASGGAIYLIAGNAIRVTGRINASGAAGAGGIRVSSGGGGGGGGGGSGGLIGLDAPTVMLGAASRLVANGGGGGGGGGTTGGGDGGEPNVIGGSPPFGALGGLAGGVFASGGGGGGTSASLAGGSGGNTTAGGGAGGGGGGVGFVLIYTGQLLDGGAQISPPAGP